MTAASRYFVHLLYFFGLSFSARDTTLGRRDCVVVKSIVNQLLPLHPAQCMCCLKYIWLPKSAGSAHLNNPIGYMVDHYNLASCNKSGISKPPIPSLTGNTSQYRLYDSIPPTNNDVRIRIWARYERSRRSDNADQYNGGLISVISPNRMPRVS